MEDPDRVEATAEPDVEAHGSELPVSDDELEAEVEGHRLEPNREEDA